MAFTKIAAAGIGSTELVTLHSLEVLNNATVGGVLTYEDVTNVDSVGLITARNGIVVGSGITLSKDGDIFATGVTTSTTFVGNLTGNVTGNISGGTVAGSTGTFTGDVDIADKIVHTGDTDTAIRFSGADTITAETGGSERLRITSTGLVGINESSPGTHLHVNSGTYNGVATFESTDADANILIKDNSTHANGTYFGVEGDDFRFITHDGSSSAERLRIDSSGRLLLGTTTEGVANASKFTIAETGHCGMTIRSGTSHDGQIAFSDGTSGDDEYRGQIRYNHAANYLSLVTNASEALRIESNTRVLVGHTDNIIVGGHLARLQISGTDYNQSTVSIMANSNDGNGAYLMLGHQRSGAAGGTTILNDGDEVGVIRFAACDGNDLSHPTAEIKSHVDGTPGENDMPGRLTFYTTADGGTAKIERMRIRNNGLVTQPYQYYLLVDRSSNQTGYDANGSFGTPIVFNRIVTEQKDSSLSSAFNTSNGLFTAPVDGIYHLVAAAYGNGVTFTQSWFTYNGARMNYADWVIQGSIVQNSQIVYLSAGNTVGYHPHAGGGNSSVTIQANGNHTYMKVTLLH